MKDLTGQVNGVDSILDSEWNPMYQEFKNLIVDMVAAMNPASSDQLGQVLAEAVARMGFYTGGGTAQAQTAAIVGGIQGLSKLTNGVTIRWRPSNNNTGAAPTLAVNGTTARTIVNEDGSALVAGDLSTARDAIARYDGSNWRLSGATTVASSTAHPKRFIQGLTMGQNPADANRNQDVRMTVGECRDETNSGNIVLTGNKDKRFDAVVAIGASTGGYPPALGARVANTWYRFFIVGNTDGRVEGGWDLIANDDASALLSAYNAIGGESGWDWYRQLGWTRTTGTISEFSPFTNSPDDPNLFTWPNGIGMADWETGNMGGSGTKARVTATLDYAAPETTAILDWNGYNSASSGTSDIYAIISAIGNVNVAPTIALHTFGQGNPGSSAGNVAPTAGPNYTDILGHTLTHVDGTRQFYARFLTQLSNARAYANTIGYRFER